MPAAWPHLLRGSTDFGYESVEQVSAGGRKLPQPRAKMLGGCSSHNAMLYRRPSPAEIAEWPGWSWDKLKSYFLKAEHFTPDPKHANVNVAEHGSGGPMTTGYSYSTPLSQAVLSTAAQLGIPQVSSLNSESTPIGGELVQTTISASGRRCSTATAYLSRPVLKRENLHVLINTRVVKLLWDDHAKSRVIGVELQQTQGGPRFVAHAKKEVVICMGAVGSPQILMLSGIGPAPQLAHHGITLRHELPVGAMLKDHALAPVVFRTQPGTSLQYLGNPLKSLPSLLQWLVLGKGPCSSSGGEAMMAIQTQSGPIPNLALLVGPGYILHNFEGKPPVANADYLTIAASPVRPTSTGSLALKSSDAWDAPIIDPRYLETAADKAVMVEGIRLIQRLAETEPLRSMIMASVSPTGIASFSEDAARLSYASSVLQSFYHPASTCPIGSVVDEELKVLGVHGLRVCDASVFPDIIAGPPAATVVAFAERTADLIKRSHLH